MSRILDPYPQSFRYMSFYGGTSLDLDKNMPLKISKRVFAAHVDFYNQVQSEMLLLKFAPLVGNVALNLFVPQYWPIKAWLIFDYLYVKAVSIYGYHRFASKIALNNRVDIDPIFGYMLIKELSILTRKKFLDGMVAREQEITTLLAKNDSGALNNYAAGFVPFRSYIYKGFA